MTIYANNVAGTLAANIGPSDTLILLGPGQGAAFPAPVGDGFFATIVHNISGVVEVVICTSRSGDTLTVTRGRDNTTATSFTVGSVVEMRLCAQMLRDIDFRLSRGVANGIASLDAGTKVPVAQLPSSVPIMDGSNKILIGNIPDAVATDVELAAKANKAGDTFTGDVFAPNFHITQVTGGRINIGNDATIVDIDLPHSISVSSQTIPAQGFIQFGRGPGCSALFGWDGTGMKYAGNNVWHGGNFDPNSKLNTANPSASGGFSVTGDVLSYRAAAPSTGALFLGNSFARGLFYDGSVYQFITANVHANDFVATSDRRKKKNVRAAVVDPLLASNFKLKTWTWKTGGHGFGLIAQDVAKYAPQHVSETTDGTMGVNTLGLLLEAIVGLSAQISNLSARVAALEKKGK